MNKAIIVLDGLKTKEIELLGFDEYYTNIEFLTFNWHAGGNRKLTRQCMYPVGKVISVTIEFN
jgi:hypothetical protein